MLHLSPTNWSDAPLLAIDFIRGPKLALLPRVCKRYQAASGEVIADFRAQLPVVYAGTVNQENPYCFEMSVYKQLNRLVLEIRYENLSFPGAHIVQDYQLDTLPIEIAKMRARLETLHHEGNHSAILKDMTRDEVFFNATGMVVVTEESVEYVGRRDYYLQVVPAIPKRYYFLGWNHISPETVVNRLHKLLCS